MKNTFSKTLLASTILSSAVTAQVSAQSDIGGFALEEIVVTAQRRVQSLQDVAVAVSALGSDDITNLGWENPGDAAAQVPNMQVSTPLGDAQPLFAIRGVSMVDYQPSATGPIGVYLDESYVSSSFLHGLSMFDLDRLEVLRGPQGTLYGKNTTGGAVNLISRTPVIGGPNNGFVTLGVGDYGLGTSNGAAETTLVDDVLATRLAFNYKKNDGVWENKTGDDMSQTKNYSLRSTFNYQPTEDLNAILKISHGKSDPRSAAPRAEGTNPGGMNIVGNSMTVNPKRHQGAVDYVGKTHAEMTFANLKLSYEMGDYTLVSVSSWYDGKYLSQADTDGTSDSLLAFDWGAETTAISQDLRLVSNFDGPVNFIAGVYFGDEDLDTHVYNPAFFGTTLGNAVPAQGSAVLLSENRLGNLDRRFDVEKTSHAAYFDVNWDLAERWSLNLGLRYTEDETTRDYLNVSRLNGSAIPGDTRTEGTFVPGNALGVPAPAMPTGPGTFAWTHGPLTNASAPELSEKEEAVTGTVALIYQLDEDVMAYARYSRGYRSGAFNGGLVYADEGDAAYVSPEYVDAYELGMKGEYLDGRMRLNGAVFYYDYTDQQFVNQVGISAVLDNAGGADIYGLELEMLWLASESLTLGMGLGLIDAEYNELVLADLVNGGNIDLKGNEPVSTPDINFNFSADYVVGISEEWEGRLHLDGVYTGDQWFSAYNGELNYGDIKQDAYWVGNARFSMVDSEEKHAVSFWVANIADKEFDVYGINLKGGFGYDYFMEGAPRSYGLDYTYKF